MQYAQQPSYLDWTFWSSADYQRLLVHYYMPMSQQWWYFMS